MIERRMEWASVVAANLLLLACRQLN